MRKQICHRYRILLCFYLIACCTGSVLSQNKDYWLKIERKGIGFGFEHITVRPIEGGFLRYDIEQHFKMDVAGFNPQDMVVNGSFVVDAKFLPVSFSLWTQSPAKIKKINGKFENDRLLVSIEDDNQEPRQMELPFCNVYFDVVLADLIATRKTEKQFIIKILDAQELRVDSIHVELADTSATEIRATLSPSIEYRIDPTGRILQIELADLNIREYLTEAADAQNITYLNTSDGLTLTIHSQRSFPNVYRVIWAQLQLKWKNIPLANFNLTDNRQTIVQTNVNDNEFEVILEFVKAAARTKRLKLPIEDEKWYAYLQGDTYIQPEDYSVQQQAVAIQGSEMDAQKVVEKMLQWISNHITTDFYAETLSGPQVLKKRRGKCSEYAILFASLARAAGIPTKIVLGEVYNNDKWVGHMWNEVWLGEWVAVDAAAGIFVSGPIHIKLVDSPTVAGTQTIRTKLVDNLSVEILDFKAELDAAADIKTGITDLTYSNADYRCQISVPDTTWEISSAGDGGRIEVTMLPKRMDGVKFALTLFGVPAGTPAKTILDGRLQTLKGRLTNFQLLEEGESQLAGQTVPRVLFQSDFLEEGSESTVLVSENCLLIRGSNAYLCKATCPKDRFAEIKLSFQKILESFVLLP